MHRHADVAAVLELWRTATEDCRRRLLLDAGNELARLLREALADVERLKEERDSAIQNCRQANQIARKHYHEVHEARAALVAAGVHPRSQEVAAPKVPGMWTATKDAMPEKSRGLLAFCQGFEAHSGVTWLRTGFAFMVWHGTGWSEQHMKDARKLLAADSLEVTHWMYLVVPKEEAK